MLPRAPLLPVDLKSSWDRPLVAVAEILNTSDPMLASLLIINASLYSQYR